MKHLVIALVTALLCATANAELSVAGGADISQDRGRPYAEIRYFGENWRHWTAFIGTGNAIGADLYLTLFGIELGLGMEYARRIDDVVDTNWAYGLRIDKTFGNQDRWSISLKHRSNCKTLCDNGLLKWARIGDDHSVNHGLNFLTLRYRFK